MDECASGSHNCDASNAACTNSDGGFECMCNSGYSGNGVTCSEIDYCSSDPCDAQAICVDEPPPSASGVCTCNVGYSGSGVACEDNDECASGAHTCDGNAACTNTIGNFTCTCIAGFSGSDGTKCESIDECTEGSDTCDGNAACTDTDGSFTCSCNAGFSGTGTTCVEKAEVSFTAVLRMSEAEFGAVEQQTYKEVVASVAGVEASQVSVGAVTSVELPSRRRLLVAGISVETVVSGVAEEDTAAVNLQIRDDLTAKLAEAGLPAESIEGFSIDTPSDADSSASSVGLVGGMVRGVVGVLVLGTGGYYA